MAGGGSVTHLSESADNARGWGAPWQGCHSGGPRQTRGVGQQEPHETQQGQSQSPLPMVRAPSASLQAATVRLGSSSAEKNLEVLLRMTLEKIT